VAFPTVSKGGTESPACKKSVWRLVPIPGSSTVYDPGTTISPPILRMKKRALSLVRHATERIRNGSSGPDVAVGNGVAVCVKAVVAVGGMDVLVAGTTVSVKTGAEVEVLVGAVVAVSAGAVVAVSAGAV